MATHFYENRLLINWIIMPKEQSLHSVACFSDTKQKHPLNLEPVENQTIYGLGEKKVGHFRVFDVVSYSSGFNIGFYY